MIVSAQDMAAALDLVKRFFSMTAEQWASLTAVERSAVAGAIAGNFAAHHPAECFDLLRECVRLKDGVA